MGTNQGSWKVSKGCKNSGSKVGKGGRQDCKSQAVGTTVFFFFLSNERNN